MTSYFTADTADLQPNTRSRNQCNGSGRSFEGYSSAWHYSLYRIMETGAMFWQPLEEDGAVVLLSFCQAKSLKQNVW